MDYLHPIGLVEKCLRDSGSEQKNTHDLGPEGGSTRIPRCNHAPEFTTGIEQIHQP